MPETQPLTEIKKGVYIRTRICSYLTAIDMKKEMSLMRTATRPAEKSSTGIGKRKDLMDNVLGFFEGHLGKIRLSLVAAGALVINAKTGIILDLYKDKNPVLPGESGLIRAQDEAPGTGQEAGSKELLEEIKRLKGELAAQKTADANIEEIKATQETTNMGLTSLQERLALIESKESDELKIARISRELRSCVAGIVAYRLSNASFFENYSPAEVLQHCGGIDTATTACMINWNQSGVSVAEVAQHTGDMPKVRNCYVSAIGQHAPGNSK